MPRRRTSTNLPEPDLPPHNWMPDTSFTTSEGFDSNLNIYWRPPAQAGPRVQVINDRTERDLAMWNGRPMVETGINISPFSASNPFDEWWKGSVSAGAQVSSPNAGGSIWADVPPTPVFSDVSAGAQLSPQQASGNLDWTGEVPVPQDEIEFNQPPPPGPISGDTEWTTSPDDRRFLDTPAEESSSVDTSGGVNFGGNSMSNFGGSLTLGQYLNTPLSTMRFGEGYPNVGGGDVTYAGQTEHTPANDGTGTTHIYRDDPVFDSGNDNTGTTTINRSNDPAFETARLRALGQIGPGAFSTPQGMTIVGYDTESAAPIYRDAAGNLFVNPGTGTPQTPSHYDFTRGTNVPNNYMGGAQHSSRAANALLMSAQAFGGAPNRTTAGDAGRTRFDPRYSTGSIGDDGILRRTARRGTPNMSTSRAAGGFGRGLSRGG